MIRIDGTAGEGGGQVLRSALTLSLLTRKPFEIVQIRAGRRKPGLMPQHLQAVAAAAAVGEARVEGAHPGSRALVFVPSTLRPGHYRFDIGTAGSTSLVLQTVILPLAYAGGETSLEIVGGTHVAWSPAITICSCTGCPICARWDWTPSWSWYGPASIPAAAVKWSLASNRSRT